MSVHESTLSAPAPGAAGPAAVPHRATRREWLGLAAIALPCAVYAMDLTVLNLALPALSAELKPSASQLLWMVDIYGFFVAGFLITMGTLGDRYGRRRMLLIGAAFFLVASVLAAFSNSSEMLIAMRALLGIAGATVAPSTLSLIRNMFHDERERQFAIGIWISAFSVGGAIGPLVGGVMLEFFWWGSVFLLAVPVMGLVLIVGPKLLPEYRDPDAGRIDPASVVLSLAAVLSVIYALKHTAEHGVSMLHLVLLALGIGLGWAFLRRQSRLAYPLVDTTLFRNPRFTAAFAAYALSCLGMFGSYIFIMQVLQLVYGLSPLMAGVATLPWSLCFVIGSLKAPALAARWSPGAVLVGGLLMAAAGFVLLFLADGPVPVALSILVASTILMSLGMAPVFAIGNEMIITAAPPERAGAASALSETSAEFSGALGIAVIGSLGMALYRFRLEPQVPATLPADATASALATLGGAMTAADTAGGAVGEALRTAARTSFVDALQFAAVVGAATTLVACALVARILRANRGGPPAGQAV